MLVPVRQTFAEINLDNLVSNIRVLESSLGRDCEMIAVLKADAYGHGAVEVAQAALTAGVTRLAVGILEEGWELRKAGIGVPILVMGHTPAEQGELAAKLGLTLAVWDRDNAAGLSQAALRARRPIRLHLKVDTGMGRLGVQPDEALDVAQFIARLPGCELEGLFTHFACADDSSSEFTNLQIERFRKVFDVLTNHGIQLPLVHAANSAGALNFPDAQFNAVRIGLAMYGLYPHPSLRSKVPLCPVMSLLTRVSHVKQVPLGTPLGYGGRHVTAQASVIATLPIGYGDGYSRMLSGKAEALVRGQRVPIVGTICMDQCLADISRLTDVAPGEQVLLWGRCGDAELPVDEIAARMGTINYELVTMVSRRVPRVYVKEQQILSVRNPLLR